MLTKPSRTEVHNAEKFILACFSQSSFSARLHIRIRWHMFPFLELAKYVQKGTHFVDLGCGHGIWPLYLAWKYPEKIIQAFDPAENKIEVARSALLVSGLNNLQFHLASAQEAEFFECDGISIVDVLYLVPYSQQEQILRNCAKKLRPGGRLLIKEIGQTPRWKYLINYAEELLIVRALGITFGNQFYFRTDAAWQALLDQLGLAAGVVRLDHGYPHPHVLIYGDKL
jgi:2-polyprenyl-3-methyl-5-hydroxy-6-metoxy-1,4-benzoquinol methylase